MKERILVHVHNIEKTLLNIPLLTKLIVKKNLFCIYPRWILIIFYVYMV
jgi:hypothetical protein